MRRVDALATGEIFYQGRPCPHGHVGVRYSTSGGCVDCVKAHTARAVGAGYFRQHYHKNPEEIRQKQELYRTNNREAYSGYAKRWGKSNPDKLNAIKRANKAKRRCSLEVGMARGMMGNWVKNQDKVCFYCGSECASNFQVDHFVPLTKGGAHLLGNLRIACKTCNLRKSAKLPNVWIEEIHPHQWLGGP